MQRLIFYSLTEAETFDLRLIDRGVADIKSRGFDTIYLENRNLRADWEASRVLAAQKRVCQAAARVGLKVVMNAGYNVYIPQMIRDNPEVFDDPLVPVRLDLKDGRFELAGPEEVLHRQIEGCWLIEPAKGTRLRKATDLLRRLKLEKIHIIGGGCGMTDWKGRAIATAQYRVAGAKSGRLLVVVRHRYEYAYNDLGHPAMRKYVDRIIDRFKDLPIEGYCWDEPHFGFAFFNNNGRPISERMYAEFRRRFGYDLKPRLIDHWYDLPDGRSPMTRLHFSELMEQDLADLEAHFQRRAGRALKGKRVFLGIHRTMHEETSDDLFIGSVDYFRHNRFTSGGFTDSVFGREDSMIAMCHLARSLAADKGEGAEAYNNSWGFDTHEAQHDYYLSLMSAMNVRWIGHTYHSSQMFGPGYPHHDCWATLRRHLDEHRDALKLLDGSTPDADTAVLYNWRALASDAGNYLHVHRRNLLLMAKQFTLAGVQFRTISVEQLESAKPRGGEMVTKTGRYRRLIVPWPDLLTEKAWAALEAIAKRVEVIIFGPPARRTNDGRDVSRRFAKLCGVRTLDERETPIGSAITLGKKSHRLDPLRIEPNYRSNERQTYPDAFRLYALRPASGAETIAQSGKDAVGVRNGRVTYFGCEVPHYVGMLDALIAPPAWTRGAKDLLLFASTRGQERILSGASRWSRPVTTKLKFEGHTIDLRNCTLFVATISGGRLRVMQR
jgi:hypothetical protein